MAVKRSVYANTSIVLLGFLAAWGLLFPFASAKVRQVSRSVMERIKKEALEPLGLRLNFESLSPSIFGTLKLRQVAGGSMDRDLASIGTLVASYDPLALFGPDPLSAIDSVDISNANLEVDLERDKALLERLSGRGGTGKAVKIPRIRLSGKNVRLTLRDLGTTIRLDCRSFEASNGQDGISLRIAGTAFYEDPAGRFTAKRAELPFQAVGILASDGKQARLDMDIGAKSDLGSVSVKNFTLLYRNDVIEIKKVRDSAPIDMAARYDIPSGNFKLELAFDRFRPDSFMRPAGTLSFLSPWFAEQYSGTLELSGDGSARGTEGSVRMTCGLPGIISENPLSLSLDASGNFESIKVRDATLGSSDGAVSLEGSLFPSKLGLDARISFSYGRLGIDFASTVDVYGQGGEYILNTDRMGISGSWLSDVSAAVSLKGDSLSFSVHANGSGRESGASSASGFTGQGGLEAGTNPEGPEETNRISVEGSLGFGDSPYLEAILDLKRFDLADVGDPLGIALGVPGKIASRFTLNGIVSVFSDFDRFSYASSGLLVVSDDYDNVFGLAVFDGNPERLDLPSMELSVAGRTIKGKGMLDYGTRSVLGFSAALNVAEVPYSFEGSVMDGVVTVKGDYDLDLFVKPAREETVFSLSMSDFPVSIAGGMAFLGLSSTGTYRTQENWSVGLSRFELVPSTELDSRIPGIGATGRFDSKGGKLEGIEIKDKYSSVAGSASFEYSLENGMALRWTLAAASVPGPGQEGRSAEAYDVEGSYAQPIPGSATGPTMSLDARILGFPLERLRVEALGGTLDANVRASGPLADPEAEFSFALNDRGGLDKLKLKGSGRFADSEFALRDLFATYRMFRIEKGSGSLNLVSGAISADAALLVNLGASPISGQCVLEGKPRETRVWKGLEDLDAALLHYRFSGFVDSLMLAERDIGRVPVDASIDAGVFRITMGDGGEVNATITGDGVIDASLSATLPLSAKVKGRVSGGTVALDCSDAVVDIPFLFTVVPLPVARVISGTGRGFARITGSVSDPDFSGSVEFQDFRLAIPDFIPDIVGPVKSPLTLSGKRMSCEQPDLAVGKDFVSLRFSSTFSEWLPRSFDIGVSTVKDHPVRLKTSLIGMDIAGSSDVDIGIKVGEDEIRIEGAMQMQKGEVILTPRLLGTGGDGSADGNATPIVAAVSLRIGKGVKFYFPTRNRPIVSGNSDPNTRIDVDFNALESVFSVKGKAVLRGGTAFYIGRGFYLKNAVIDFNENQAQFDPIVNIEAEKRATDESGPVLIRLTATNQRLSSLSFRLDSVPGKTEQEIARLLGQELFETSATGGPVDLGRIVVTNYDFILPRLNVIGLFEQNVQDLFGLDIFYVNSQVIQRWVYDVVSGLGSLPGESATFADYLDNTSITAGKYLGENLFVQAMVRLQENPLVSGTGLRLDSEYSLEWDTPLFLLNWRFRPEHPEDLFVTDQSLSLFWRVPLR